jgi:ABC-type amino acid transport substrate-binding protein
MTLLPAALVVSLIAGAVPAFAQGNKLILSNEGSYPPFSITKPDGTLTGVDVELARELCRRAKYECEFQVMEFKAQLPALIAGKVDMIAGGLSPRPERLAATEFLDPHILVRDGWLLSSTWDKGIDDKDLKGLRIGFIKGAAWVDFAKAQRPSMELVTYDNLNDIYLDMSAGRIQGAYGPELGFAEILKGKADANKWKFIAYTFEGRPTVGNSFAVQKGKIELRDKLNKALAETYEDCTYTKIRKEFVTIRLSPREPDRCM